MFEFFFSPKSVAVIGASRNEQKLGYGVLLNIIQSGFEGRIYPINPKADEILNLKCYPSVLDVPDDIDLAVVVIPARYVLKAVEECGRKGVKGVIVISAGFKEVGGEGAKLEQELVRIVRQYGMRMIGPNVLGLIDTITPINASFSAGMPHSGSIAFMSQSGALCTSVLDMSLAEGIGFSRFVSLGNKADFNEIDLLEAWEKDPHSKVITAYLEGIVDGVRFLEVARRVTKTKPIIAIKSGTTEAGARAVSSHTGTLAGSEKAYEAAFRQAGIIRVFSVQELFDYAVGFARQPAIKGGGIAIVTNAGGPGIMMTDACERFGVPIARFSRETIERLRAHLPPAANVLNPVDVIGDALADRYAVALETVLNDPNVGGAVVILTPQVMTQIEETAKVVGEIASRYDKPVLGCFMGKATTEKGVQILREYSIPNYEVPERAAGVFRAMYEYKNWLETPPLKVERYEFDRDRIKRVISAARSEGRLTLGDTEAREIIQACGISVPKTGLARTPEEAVRIADEIGYPVVMKIASPDILHKTDVGGVKLNIQTPEDVRDTFDLFIYRATRYMPDATIWGCQIQQMVRGGREVIVGISHDPQFGPLLMFGLGGIYVEALRDVSFRIIPLSRREATEMVNEIKSIRLLRGFRGEPPSDIDSVVDVILRVAQLSMDFPEIIELDINPLMVMEVGKGAIAVDVRMVLSSK
ncbi:TPA: CoA-binding protein [Candidatus Poribacteria bacterium]|nr:CoA-binding protein [Candidatus Poribacteria bacterium]HEX29302.1 CoA-binding protein [Candidatus Poribacteria bacterium]